MVIRQALKQKETPFSLSVCVILLNINLFSVVWLVRECGELSRYPPHCFIAVDNGLDSIIVCRFNFCIIVCSRYVLFFEN